MSSKRRITSSRANGAKSCGPVTAAGKYNSSRNNLRHGFLAKSAVLEEERSEAFSQLLADLCREHNAQTETQLTLVEHMAMARWRIARLWAIERELLQSEIHKPEHIRLSPTSRVTRAFASLVERDGVFNLLNRYKARLDRQDARSLNLLIKLADPDTPLTEFFHSNPVPESDTTPVPPEPLPSTVENVGEIVPAASGIGFPAGPSAEGASSVACKGASHPPMGFSSETEQQFHPNSPAATRTKTDHSAAETSDPLRPALAPIALTNPPHPTPVLKRTIQNAPERPFDFRPVSDTFSFVPL